MRDLLERLQRLHQFVERQQVVLPAGQARRQIPAERPAVRGNKVFF